MNCRRVKVSKKGSSFKEEFPLTYPIRCTRWTVTEAVDEDTPICIWWLGNSHVTVKLNLHLFLRVPFLMNSRSCIIGPQLEVKICTLGSVINRTQYAADYVHLEGTGRQSQPMPIRWMSWESSLMVSRVMDEWWDPDLISAIFKHSQGKFSSKSDVWSFAVTLWEILTFAREQPYENMSDEKVFENIGHIYQDDKKHVSD